MAEWVENKDAIAKGLALVLFSKYLVNPYFGPARAAFSAIVGDVGRVEGADLIRVEWATLPMGRCWVG